MPLSSVVSRIAHESCTAEPSLLGDGPWWECLESNFYKRPEGFDLEMRDQLRVRGTAGMDVLIRTLGATLVSGLALPMGYSPLHVRTMRKDAAFYADRIKPSDPNTFFKPPPSRVTITRRKPAWPYYKPDDGVCEDLTFASPFEPVNQGQRKSYLRHRANRVAHARYWRHLDGPRPTIIAIHGFTADPYWLNEWFFALPWFYQQGADVLLFTLPFHGARQTRFSAFSGHGFFSGGIPRINEAFAHAIHDLRVFINFMQNSHGIRDIGVTGVSLGGYTTALLAAVEPSIRFAIPNVPVISIADLVMEWEPAATAIRALLATTRLSIKDVRHMLAVTCPLTYAPVLARDRLMIIAGVGDRLAPPKHSRLLWEHWGRCRIHWFPGSHLLHLDKGDYLKEMRSFLDSMSFM